MISDEDFYGGRTGPLGKNFIFFLFFFFLDLIFFVIFDFKLYVFTSGAGCEIFFIKFFLNFFL